MKETVMTPEQRVALHRDWERVFGPLDTLPNRQTFVPSPDRLVPVSRRRHS